LDINIPQTNLEIRHAFLEFATGDVLGYLATYEGMDEIIAEYPELTREDIRACLAFAAARERGFIERVAA
jgi:uncharacterized protein (DUF433 family)